MDIFFRLILIILACKAIYNLVNYLAFSAKKKYFHAPITTIDSIPQQEVYEFKPTVLELINKFSWSLMAVALLVVMAYRSGGTTVFLMLLFFGLPFIYRIITRLAHVTDKVTVDSRELEVVNRKKREKVNMLLVKEIHLRYYLDKSSGFAALRHEFTFKTGIKEQNVHPNDGFFLHKAERMLVTMQKLLPDRRFLIVWEDSIGNKEFLEVKNY
jgi:hypothetical protein